MPLEERRRRQAELFQVLVDNDISHWADRFLDRLKKPAQEPELPLRLRVV
jgi:trehalose-6-phosphate synthase